MIHSIVAHTVVESLTTALAVEARRAIAETTAGKRFDARESGVKLGLHLIPVVAFGSSVLSLKDQQIVTEAFRQVMADRADKIFRADARAPWAYLAQRGRIDRSTQNMQLVVGHVHGRAPNSVTSRALSDLGLSAREAVDELLTFLLVGHDRTDVVAAATVPGLADQIAAEAATVRDEKGAIDVAKFASATTITATVREILGLTLPAFGPAAAFDGTTSLAIMRVPLREQVIRIHSNLERLNHVLCTGTSWGIRPPGEAIHTARL